MIAVKARTSRLLQSLRSAVARRVRGPYRSLGRLDSRLDAADQSRTALADALELRVATLTQSVETRLGALTESVETRLDAITHSLEQRVGSLEATVTELGALAEADHALLTGEFRGTLRALASEEPANRRALHALRSDPGYEAAWTDPDPLVSVTVVTRDRHDLLTERTLPSILGQTHRRLEVIVVGDHADERTATAVASLADPRVTYINLPHRLDLGLDPRQTWMVAATMARNEATRHVRGQWLVCFDDDDALRPDAIERLLELARRERSEVAYGRARQHHADDSEATIGTFPPALAQFTFAAAIYHAGLGYFERELVAAHLQTPGDWFAAERMLRSGVRFAFTDAVICDVYPAGPRPGG